MADRPPAAAALVLAGGAGRRFGGPHKPLARIGDDRLVDRALAACAGLAARIVVGDLPDPPAGVLVVPDDEPGQGPVAALRSGLRHVQAPWVVLLAADLPFLHPATVDALRAAAAADGTGAYAVDDGERAQWLLSAWRRDALSAAAAGYAGRRLGELLGGLGGASYHLDDMGGPPAWYDCDTPERLEEARRWASRTSGPESTRSDAG